MGVLRRSAAIGLAVPILMALTVLPASAQDLSPVNTFFQTLGDALTGTTGRAIGVVALAGVGLAFLGGKLPVMAAASVALGLVILYGAATILAGF